MSFQRPFPPPPGPPPGAPLPGSQPVGSRPPAPVSIESFTPPPSRVTPAVVFVVIALSVIIAAVGFGVFGRSPAPAEPTPTPSVSATVPTRSGGLEFESSRDNAAGYWQILDTRRTGNVTVITVRIELDKGRMGYQFYAYDNADARSYDPEPLGPPPHLSDGQLSAGQKVEGTLSFRVPGNNLTLILANGSGAPVSGLAVRP